MSNLLLVLLVLFISLAIVVKLTERFGKPMEPEQQSQLSRVAMILIALLLLVGLFRSCSGV
ncbi:hypothetical protein [Oceanicoccus sp. KOV_DT_Chl]|uniref:hypothetical protein n=1 Tax=Oceanicoccus sp. KOV_DT_Chl TaxID=1904639 RepID=UPI000C7AFB79|nr:hypothetical protein [Oceanicoccus sp. KOV_DT_Chl]